MATRIDRDVPPEGPRITGFHGRGFKVDGQPTAGGLLLTPETAIDWVPPAAGALTEADLARLVELRPAPEFILLGTGASTIRPPLALVAALEARGIGLDVMDSRAAARAWGVLRGEDRWIAAALMPL